MSWVNLKVKQEGTKSSAYVTSRHHRNYQQTMKSSVVATSTPHSHALPHQICIQNALNKLTIRHAGRYRSGKSKTNLGDGPLTFQFRRTTRHSFPIRKR